MIKVLFFGPITTLTGCRELDLAHTPGIHLQDVLAQIDTRYPAASAQISFIAVNETHAHDKHMPLSDGDVVALLAKFSGG
uniref:Putative Molybdopterin-converting factor subunit 1 (MPT synthase subunit 1) (Molybdopterin synthase subunit 1) (Molybdenum cofactor biosynthesis protein D) (Molybdopterin-converting factor small su... n=1 Tax=mine drainage metagenome TaxID=410659 RepID=E6QSW6_9ZZZZ